jgi:hypothetical protein
MAPWIWTSQLLTLHTMPDWQQAGRSAAVLTRRTKEEYPGVDQRIRGHTLEMGKVGNVGHRS